ncbi:MAG TPA: DUF3631 domain-containing protein [Edaphobacter sp.]|uniref:DUF3631 domain-containing protein n=1 Tax=Edaphobacter sp. TaxID=1934404 RepID=UPI002B984F04|nr:DUF3631 domain-containing protein [Edaphobacter sp.]HUZ93840.1 DUF3631 domain-containing protein [Edaphobacter sp.]
MTATVKNFTCEQVARAALGGPTKRAGTELLWRCPRHEDKHESLSINPQKNVFLCGPCDASGTAWGLAAFLAGLDAGDKPGVTAWLTERGLLKGKRPAKTASAKSSGERGHVVATYEYRDADGKPAARKLRIEPGPDGKKKTFAWQRWEVGAWVDGLGSGSGSMKPPLYRLPEIKVVPFVVLTEGEKDADAGAALGLPTTTSGGTGTFRHDHADALRGKDVVIVSDADDPGREHAQKVAAMLFGKALSVKVLELPGAKDLAEAIAKGVSRDVLHALFEDTPEWKPSTGTEVLDKILAFIRKFVSLTESQAHVVALWAVHTHAMDGVDCTPYLAITSAEKESGKSRLLEVLELLVANPWLTARVSAAVLVRKIDTERPTLLLDESDTAFGAEKEYAEALRGVLNSGYRRGGAASLCVGQGTTISYKDFSTFCAKAIAGIGGLPDTVASRAIPIRLKRAKRGEAIERFRRRDAQAEAASLREQMGAWTVLISEILRSARPELPDALSDRQQDVAEPLLAIADAAGGKWPKIARLTIVDLCAQAQVGNQSIGEQLLADIKEIFEVRDVDRISSSDLATALAEIETSPWGEWGRTGKPISAAKLARLLRPYGITPDTIRIADKTPKGYTLEDFADAFERHLRVSAPPCQDPQSATTQQNDANVTEEQGLEAGSRNVSKRNIGQDDGGQNREELNKTRPCGVVALSLVSAGAGEDEVVL